MSGFGFQTTALEVVKGLSLVGWEIIVTGGASGIGTETVRALASVGANVTIAARNTTAAQEVADNLKKELNTNKIEVEQLDLTSLKNINSFVQRYLAKNRPLNVLINNAGIMACDQAYTEDGFEMQIGTNHFGHFALFKGLLPALRNGVKQSGRNSRVVSVSSLAHLRGGIDFDDIHFKTRPYDKWIAYGQSKTANSLFAVELTNRYKNEGIFSNALHPGVIKTNLGRHTENDTNKSPIEFKYKTIPQGASTTVWAATSPQFENVGGLYLNDTQIAKEQTLEQCMADQAGYVSYAVNPADAKRFWEISEQSIAK